MAHQEIVELLRPQVLRTRWLFPWHLWFYIAFLAAVLWVDVANLVGYWTNPVLLAVQAGVTALTIGLLVYTGFVLRQAYGLARLDDDLASVVRRRLRFFEGQYGLWLWLAAASVALASWAVSTLSTTPTAGTGSTVPSRSSPPCSARSSSSTPRCASRTSRSSPNRALSSTTSSVSCWTRPGRCPTGAPAGGASGWRGSWSERSPCSWESPPPCGPGGADRAYTTPWSIIAFATFRKPAMLASLT
jgi:hypothetical protein